MSCKAGYIINPKTNRCVKKTGKIGMEILAQQKNKMVKQETVKKNSAVKPELPKDVMVIIGEKANSATKKNMIMTSKYLKDIVIKHDDKLGRENYKFFLTYLKSFEDRKFNNNYTDTFKLTLSTKCCGRLTVVFKSNEISRENKINFLKSTTGEVVKSIGTFTYKFNYKFNDFKLSDHIQKSQLKWLSKLFDNISYVYDSSLNINDKILKPWNDHIQLHI